MSGRNQILIPLIVMSALCLTLRSHRSSGAAEAPETHAGGLPASGTILRLWEGDAPGAKGSAKEDIPTLTVFAPKAAAADGAAMVICPGGGYQGLAGYEGQPVAEWLNTVNVTGFVLRYRLAPKYHHPVMMQDVQRAMRIVRAHATEWGLDRARIGVLGFSAGGHLASTAATHFDEGKPDASDPVEKVGSRPDLAVLIYPVITMGSLTHGGSRDNLLGPSPSQELVDLMSNEKQVTARTPPCFLVHGFDDAVVPVENSIAFFEACRAHHVIVEAHFLAHGGHGFGLGAAQPDDNWPPMCEGWMRWLKFVK